MQIDVEGIENQVITSIMHDYGGVGKKKVPKRHICEKTPLHNPSNENGLQCFVGNCQGKKTIRRIFFSISYEFLVTRISSLAT